MLSSSRHIERQAEDALIAVAFRQSAGDALDRIRGDIAEHKVRSRRSKCFRERQPKPTGSAGDHDRTAVKIKRWRGGIHRGPRLQFASSSTVPARAVDPQHLAGLDHRARRTRRRDGGKSIFAAHDGRMRHHPADVGDGGADLAEHRGPAGRGHRRDEDLAVLDLIEFVGRTNNARPAFDDPGRCRHSLKPRAVGRALQPCGDAIAGDTPQHDRERFGHDRGRLIERRLRPVLRQGVHDLSALRDPLRPKIGPGRMLPTAQAQQ